MRENQDVLDAMMGFDPSDTNPFSQDSTSKSNPNIYKTNPVARDGGAKSEDGVYRSKVRIIYNPYNYLKSIVSKTEWYCKGSNGSFLVNALLDKKENRNVCPLMKASSKVFLALDDFATRFAIKTYPNDAAKREALLAEFNSVTGRGKEAWTKKFKGTELGQKILEYGKEVFDNTTSTWVLVQILEDVNKPELVGQFKLMKLPKVVASKIEAKQYPSKESGKKPVDLMSWVLGYPLEMEVEPGEDDPQNPDRKQREISYDKCDFSTDFEPIHKIDGSNLFTDEQLEILEEFATARKDAETAKSQKKKDEAIAKIAKGTDLYNKVLEMTGIARDYLINEAKVIDLAEEIEYKPWDEATTKRVQDWIDEVTFAKLDVAVAEDAGVKVPSAEQPDDSTESDPTPKDENLPF